MTEELRSLGAQIELRHLRYAVAAADCGSFRRAAEALGVKQSTLSRCISQLEERLGVVLFETIHKALSAVPEDIAAPPPDGLEDLFG